jgi:hypothetical protein
MPVNILHHFSHSRIYKTGPNQHFLSQRFYQLGRQLKKYQKDEFYCGPIVNE